MSKLLIVTRDGGGNTNPRRPQWRVVYFRHLTHLLRT